MSAAHERRTPPVVQIPILLIAVVLGVVGLALGAYERLGDGVPWWVTALPFAGTSAALTLVLADVIKHQHLGSAHVKAFAFGISPLAAGLFAWTLGYALFIVIAMVVLSLLGAIT